MIFPRHLQEVFACPSQWSFGSHGVKKEFFPGYGRLFMLEPTRYSSGSTIGTLASDERTDDSFFWSARKTSAVFPPPWCHLRLLFLLYLKIMGFLAKRFISGFSTVVSWDQGPGWWWIYTGCVSLTNLLWMKWTLGKTKMLFPRFYILTGNTVPENNLFFSSEHQNGVFICH